MDCTACSTMYCCSMFGIETEPGKHPVEEYIDTEEILVEDFEETYPDEEDEYTQQQQDSSAYYNSPVKIIASDTSSSTVADGPPTREVPGPPEENFIINQLPEGDLHNDTDSPYRKLLTLYAKTTSSVQNDQDEQNDPTANASSAQQEQQRIMTSPKKSPFKRDFSRILSFSNISPQDLPEES
mmetsp:Transcript_24749/g.29792  ORF Transcript_24749/g.29792 Transcript_24749/m.29792 type:complete len:183 (+) Transcript_24749:40-588(+)